MKVLPNADVITSLAKFLHNHVYHPSRERPPALRDHGVSGRCIQVSQWGVNCLVLLSRTVIHWSLTCITTRSRTVSDHIARKFYWCLGCSAAEMPLNLQSDLWTHCLYIDLNILRCVDNGKASCRLQGDYHYSNICKGYGCLNAAPLWYYFMYRQVSNIRLTIFQHLKDYRTDLQLSLSNPLKPDVKSRMKL